jgi:beta-glucanase (GH16 family)
MLCRVLFALLLAIATYAKSIGDTCCPPPPSNDPVPGTWTLTFEDDFEGVALNPEHWTASNFSDQISRYDGHAALFVADRVSVSGGQLRIDTVLETTTFQGVTYNFTSGWIDSQHKVNQTKGRFEARMKMPNANATGGWPSWWLLPEGECWPVSGEVDIMEIWMGEGHEQHSTPGNPISIASTYHWGYSCYEDESSYPTNSRWFPDLNNKTAPLIDFSSDFHVFGVEINDTALRFYVDSQDSFVQFLPELCITQDNYHNHTPYMPFSPLYGIIAVAVSQGQGGNDWWKSSNATTLVDWVKWYEFVPSSPVSTLLAAPPPLPPATPVPGNWVMTFEETFDGSALNTSRWTVANWSSVKSEYDGHDALFTAERVSVGGGHLRIDTVLESNTLDGILYNMTSGWLDTQQKVNQTKGRFEASIKMPNPNATGTWPAWWLLPEGECWPISGEM